MRCDFNGMVILAYIRRVRTFWDSHFSRLRLRLQKKSRGSSYVYRLLSVSVPVYVCLFISWCLMYAPVNLWCANTDTQTHSIYLCVIYFRNKAKLKKEVWIYPNLLMTSLCVRDFFVCVLVSVRSFVNEWMCVSESDRMWAHEWVIHWIHNNRTAHTNIHTQAA